MTMGASHAKRLVISPTPSVPAAGSTGGKNRTCTPRTGPVTSREGQQRVGCRKSGENSEHGRPGQDRNAGRARGTRQSPTGSGESLSLVSAGPDLHEILSLAPYRSGRIRDVYGPWTQTDTKRTDVAGRPPGCVRPSCHFTSPALPGLFRGRVYSEAGFVESRCPLNARGRALESDHSQLLWHAVHDACPHEDAWPPALS